MSGIAKASQCEYPPCNSPDQVDSDLSSSYKKAYESMKACPLPFEHPSQAQQLNGLGPKLCDRLTDKLKVHCQENGLPMPEPPGQGML